MLVKNHVVNEAKTYEAVVYKHLLNKQTEVRTFNRQQFEKHFLERRICIWIQISLNIVSRSHIDNYTSFTLIMALQQTGVKPFSEPMMTEASDALWYY